MSAQPQLDLAPTPVDPASERALRVAYQSTDWKRRGITFAHALAKPALRITLRIKAEILARNAVPH